MKLKNVDLKDKKPKECAPGIEGDVCSRDGVLHSMQKFIQKETGKDIRDPKEILTHMNKLLNCDRESCVLSHPDFVQTIGPDVAEKEKTERMRPKGPSDNDNLLTNFNIDEVLGQYTKSNPIYHHIPYKMIDFAETEPSTFSKMYGRGMNQDYIKSVLLSFMNPEMFVNTVKKCAGVVLNTDVSSGRGKHWFALFFDFRNINHITLEYFNSSGNMMPQEVHEFMIKYQRKVNKLLPQSQCTIETASNIQLQESQTECGVYSLVYIILRLEGTTLDAFRRMIQTNGFPDELMLKLRSHLFRKY